jgi:hypothetical protein
MALPHGFTAGHIPLYFFVAIDIKYKKKKIFSRCRFISGYEKKQAKSFQNRSTYVPSELRWTGPNRSGLPAIFVACLSADLPAAVKRRRELLLLERRRRAGSCNDLPFQNQSNQNKIDVIENSTCGENESVDEILCEMELR